MTYEEIVEKVRKTLKKADASVVEEHTAIQINVIGEGEGAFYVELDKDRIEVEPYEYFDRDILVTTTADNLMDVVEGRIDVINANLTGKITADGDLRKAENLRKLRESITEKAEKKTSGTISKSAAKRTADTVKEKKTAAKKPVKKTTAKKPAVQKTEKKTTAKKPAKKVIAEKTGE